MKCQSVQIWLMQVETLNVKDWPRNMNRHLKRCPACAKTARTLYKIEEGWRKQPIPAECDKAKAAFLEKLPTLHQPKADKPKKTSRRQKRAKTIKIPPRRSSPYRWLAAAAVLFIGVILTGLLLPSKTQASSSDLIERLIDWEVELANAEPKDRKRILEEREVEFKKEVEQTPLSSEEHDLAEELLEDGRKLANATDVIAEAEVVQRIATVLFVRCEANDKPGHEKEFERCGQHYKRFKESGYEPMKVRFPEGKIPDSRKGDFKVPVKGSTYDWVLQQERLKKILEHSPDNSRTDLHKKIEGISTKGGNPPPPPSKKGGSGSPKAGGKK